MGHATSCQRQADKLTALNDYKTGFKTVTLGEAVAALGLEMLFYQTPLFLSMCLRQHDYGCMWVGRMEDAIGKKLVSKDTPGFASGRMFAQGGGPGTLATSARSFVSACMYAGRHSMPELVESCNFLSCFFNDWCVLQDAGLLH